jgi:hypothetical protein
MRAFRNLWRLLFSAPAVETVDAYMVLVVEGL